MNPYYVAHLLKLPEIVTESCIFSMEKHCLEVQSIDGLVYFKDRIGNILLVVPIKSIAFIEVAYD